MPDEIDKLTDEAKKLLDPSFLEMWQVRLAAAVLVLIIMLMILRKIRRAIRRRGPVKLHPKLQKYGRGYYDAPDPEHLAQQRDQAQQIVATSSNSTIVGFEIVEQVEAVYVDGFHTSDDAMQGLKAMAAMKGANAIVNTTRGKDPSANYTAAGDAVIVRKRGQDTGPESVQP